MSKLNEDEFTLYSKPFIKWNGGKSQLLHELIDNLPSNYNKFIDPFVGGGALPLAIAPEKLVINDKCALLIDAYKAIQKNVGEVMDWLDELEHEYEGEEGYYQLRREFNHDMLIIRKLDPVHAGGGLYGRASTFIFLNHRAFNGLFRLNKKGEFNVPYRGKKPTLDICQRLVKASDVVKNAVITNSDYKETLAYIEKNDFVFLDPPYLEDGHGSTSQMYGGESIVYDEFVDFLKEIDRRGAHFLTTNNATAEARKLFRLYKIQEVETKRCFRPNGKDRRGLEFIITNY